MFLSVSQAHHSPFSLRLVSPITHILFTLTTIRTRPLTIGITTILRGFKVPLPILNAFLLANNINESEVLCRGIPPFYDYDSVDKVTMLLRNKVGNGDTKTQIFVPSRMGFNFAPSAYIAYNWTVVFAQRRLGPTDLDDSPPPGL